MFNKVYEISSSLRRARFIMGWTQQQAGDFLGITDGRVSQLEQRARPSDEHHARLREAVAQQLLKEAGQLVLERRRELQHLAHDLGVTLATDRAFLREFRRQHGNRARGFAGLLLTLGTGDDVIMPPSQWLMLFGFPEALFHGLPRERVNGVDCVRAVDVGLALEGHITGRRYEDLARPDFPGARELIRTIGCERLWSELAFRVPRWAQFSAPWTAAEAQALSERAERSKPRHTGAL